MVPQPARRTPTGPRTARAETHEILYAPDVLTHEEERPLKDRPLPRGGRGGGDAFDGE
jgi:hypothetical protein